MNPSALFLLPALLTGAVQDPVDEKTSLLSELGDAPAAGMEVVYLGDEGFLFRAARKVVLVDPFLPGVDEATPAIPEEVLEAIGSAKKPFANVTLSVSTHHHGKGLRNELILAFLKSQPRPMVQGTPEVIAQLFEFLEPEDEKHSIHSRWQEPGAENRTSFPGLIVDFLNLPLAGDEKKKAEHFGLRIVYGGKKIVHLAHAALDPERLAAYKDRIHRADVLIVPHTYLLDEESVKILRQHIAPLQVIATGVPVKGREEMAVKLAEVFPRMVMFGEPGDRHLVPPRKRQ